MIAGGRISFSDVPSSEQIPRKGLEGYMSTNSSKEEVLDEIRILTKEYLDLVFKDSNDSSTISSLMTNSLTSTNNKIIDLLTSDKQLETTVVEQLLGILKANNDEFLKLMVQRTHLEEKRLELIETTIQLHKIRLNKL